MDYFVGIDMGSSAVKILIINEEKKIVGYSVNPTGSFIQKNTVKMLENLLNEIKLTEEDIKFIVSTGYGRKLFSNAGKNISEITANAVGANAFSDKERNPKTVINIGGQDSKIIVLDEYGRVKNFMMNDKCAAGTGRFLEMSANYLELEVDQLEVLHLYDSPNNLSINTTCAVFAESEIISLLSNGYQKSEIVTAVHYSIAKRILRLASRIDYQVPVFFDGGAALNKGLADALEKEFKTRLTVPENPQITTAFGASLIALESYSQSGKN